MSVLEILIPFEEIKVRYNNFSESLWLSDMKRNKKNLFKYAQRQGSARLFERCKKVDKKIRSEEQKSNTKKIQSKILQGGQRGLCDAAKMAQNRRDHNGEIGFELPFFTRVSTMDHKYGSYLLSKDP
jgi:hypothetical protein